MMRRIVLGLLAAVIVVSGFLLNSDHQQPTYVYAVTVGTTPKNIPDANVTVPDVVGLPFEDAASKVERAGLYVAEPAQEVVAGRLTDRIENVDAALTSPVRQQTPA